MTRAERNIAWIEKFCRVPEGRLIGRPARLREWQRAELRKIYDNPHGTRLAILSFGRKNGKTALAAWLLELHTVGPEAKPNSQLYSAAQARKQAAILFGLAAKSARLSPDIVGELVIRDTAKEIACPELGTLYTALSAEASTAYGLSPVFTVHDELGQVKGPRSELYEALETATGGQESPLSIIISTQAPTDSDLLSILIDDAISGADPRIVVSLYTAPTDLDPFDVETIKLANPAFGDFQNADEVFKMADAARRMPSRESSYRNLILNQRVTVESPFVSRSVWASNGSPPREITGAVYGALDLSEVNDLTSLTLVEPAADVWGVHPTFWLPLEGLAERARQDRVPYDVWHRDGFLQTTPGRSIEYEFVADELWHVCQMYDVRAILFDRWNWRHLRSWLLKAGFSEIQVDGDEDGNGRLFVEFGQGFASMSPALRDLESLLLNGKIAHGNHPVLTMCAGNAVVKIDDAGNRKLSKAKSYGRIDGMVTLAMAVAGASTYESPGDAVSFWETMGTT
jgi:phage terminase large subunit-like protein